MLEKTLSGTSCTVYPEEPDTRPKRADWIIDQPTSFMLVECKTKRMTIGARTNIQDDMEIHAQLEVIGKAAVQTYQALEAYKNGKYRPQQYPFNPMKRAFVCVVTLENWHLMGPELEKLRKIVRDKLAEAGLAPSLMEQGPFILCAVNEMEEFAYLLRTKGLEDLVLAYWNDEEKSSWSFISYLHNKFMHELESYQHVFAGEFETIFTVK
jgi:hypothetical protein